MHLVGGSIAFGRICGALICALCSVELGNEEGIFRCERHSGNPNEPEDDLANKYKELKTQQEAYDSRQRKKLKYNAVILRGQEMMDDDDDDDNVIITARTSSSLQQKWSKFVLPLVTKFCSLAQRYPMSSGECKLLLFFFPCLLLVF